jgi:eight-cysteine-cluster-containing protein
MGTSIVIFLLLASCTRNNGAAPASGANATPVTEATDVDENQSGSQIAEVTTIEEVPEQKPELPSPEKLYETCKDRVEQPEQDGECTADDDCARSGCGREVCTTLTAARELMTTCEKRMCFDALDQCGCADGRCSWTLKDASDMAPPLKTVIPR